MVVSVSVLLNVGRWWVIMRVRIVVVMCVGYRWLMWWIMNVCSDVRFDNCGLYVLLMMKLFKIKKRFIVR